MNPAFYLDDARWGLASSSVQRAQTDFARLSGDPRGLLYFAEFLRHGFEAWPDAMQRSYPGLCNWRGVGGLADALRRVTSASQRVVFASRTASLMQLAAADLSRHCRRVLTTDLLWRPYREILAQACRQQQVQLRICRLRSKALRSSTTDADLGEVLVRDYLSTGCDGLVLPQIDHRGVTLPVAQLVATLQIVERTPRRLVVDGSQAFAHVPVDLSDVQPDCFIAPAHKWLGGGHPLAMGVV
ncbi:MAG: aminotransferase class V-fold PLP-dependent enzyme, partial [Pirellulales bacterium]|nr:aminotransferase class V-fold PLP-dependent enzyme [Pirellulales bacterium]